jgi:WD40 repeat protein
VLQLLDREPERPRALNARVDRDLETICQKCLEKEQQRRYGSAEALAIDLEHWLAGEPIAARPVGNVERLWRWCRRNSTVASLLAVLFLSLAVGTGISSYYAIQANERADREKAAKLTSDRRLYAAHMSLIQRAWDNSDVVSIVDLLDTQHPQRTGGSDLRGFEWYYWNRLCRGQRTFKAHAAVVVSVAFSPDGKRVASVGGDVVHRERPGEVKIWDVGAGQEPVDLHGHTAIVSCVAFSPDGKRLATGSDDQTVRVWDLDTGHVLTLKTELGVWSVAFSPDGRHVAAGDERAVTLWELPQGKKILTLENPTVSPTTIAFDKSGRLACGGLLTNTVAIWGLAKPRDPPMLKTLTGPVYALALSPDGKRLASASGKRLMSTTKDVFLPPAPGELKIWDLATEKEPVPLRGHALQVHSIAFSPDGKRIASGSADRTIRIWDSTNGNELLNLKGHVGVVTGVAFSPDGKQLVSGGDQTARIWDAIHGQQPLALDGAVDVVQVAFDPDGKRLASTAGNAVKIYDLTGGANPVIFKGHRSAVTAIAFTTDGQGLASTSWDGDVRVWNTGVDSQPIILKGDGFNLNGLAFSPDGKRLASAGQQVRIWDWAGGQVTLTLNEWAYHVAFHPDGKLLALAGKDGTVKIWDLNAVTERWVLRGHTGFVWDVVYSANGRYLASAAQDGIVKLWDAASGQELFSCKGHTSYVHNLAFSQGGERLASASDDGTVKLWDTASGQETLTLKARPFSAGGVAFSPDGHFLASAGDQDRINIWNATPLVAQSE